MNGNGSSEKTSLKKMIALIMTAAMIMLSAAGCAGSGEQKSELFSQLEGVEFVYKSPAGLWQTSLEISPDGSFIGNFINNDAGNPGEGYPDGTVGECFFEGSFTDEEVIGDFAYRVRLDHISFLAPGNSYIEDGMRHVTENPYGLNNGEEFYIYLPGKASSELTGEFVKSLYGAVEVDEYQPELKMYGLYNLNEKTGFVGYSSDGSLAEACDNSRAAEKLAEVAADSGSIDLGTGYTVSVEDGYKTVSTDRFTITLPNAGTWDVSNDCETGLFEIYSNKSRTRYDDYLDRMTGGMLVELHAVKEGETWYKEWAKYYELGETDGRMIAANFPSDVQWNLEDETAEREYREIDEILRNGTSWYEAK